MNNIFTKEQLEKAKATKTIEELLSFAKAENITLSEEKATNLFTSWHLDSNQLTDEELNQINGGILIRVKGNRNKESE